MVKQRQTAQIDSPLSANLILIHIVSFAIAVTYPARFPLIISPVFISRFDLNLSSQFLVRFSIHVKVPGLDFQSLGLPHFLVLGLQLSIAFFPKQGSCILQLTAMVAAVRT